MSAELSNEELHELLGQMPDRMIDALAMFLRQLDKRNAPHANIARGESASVFVAYGGAGMVLKVLGEGSMAFESMIVAKLSESPKPPLAVPQLIEFDSRFPGHAIFSKVPGQVLPNELVRGFSPTEKKALGQKIGGFVAWLSTAVSIDDYRELAHESGRGMVPERTNNMRLYARKARMGEISDPTLAAVLIEVEDEYEARRETLEVSIVGHDDLRVDNFTFEQEDGLWRPAAVFDFGIAKPSGPERELRHMLPLGEEVTEATIASYESATGETLSRSLMHFWAIGQAASACAAFAGKPEIDTSRLGERVNDLVYLLPDRDWSGLTGLCTPPN